MNDGSTTGHDLFLRPSDMSLRAWFEGRRHDHTAGAVMGRHNCRGVLEAITIGQAAKHPERVVQDLIAASALGTLVVPFGEAVAMQIEEITRHGITPFSRGTRDR